MNERMPLDINHRPVRLRTIKQLAAGKRPDKRKRKRLNAAIWATIMSKAFDGEWYTIEPTHKLSEAELTRLHRQLIKKKFYQGLDNGICFIRVTSQEGICFHWPYKTEREIRAIDLIALSRRKKRMKGKAYEQWIFAHRKLARKKVNQAHQSYSE